MADSIKAKRNALIREYLKTKKFMSDSNIDYFIKEFDKLDEKEKSEVIYEMVGKEIYHTCPVDIRTFVNDPYFLGDIYGGCLFKIWRDVLDEIYPAPFLKKHDTVVLSCATRCFGKGTKILMYDGSIKNVEDIKVGDQVMGDDSTPRNVLSLARGREEMYKVTPNNGIPFVCNASHILSLKHSHEKEKGTIDIEVNDYISRVGTEANRRWHLYKPTIPLSFSEQYKPLLDPYYIGLWLADGRCAQSAISVANQDIEITEYLNEYYTKLGLTVKYSNIQKNCKDIRAIRPKGNENIITKELSKLNLIKNKHIPIELRRMSVEDRFQLLAGYLDGDGCLSGRNKTTFEIETNNKDIRDGILFIANSLGFRTYKRERRRFDKRTGKTYQSYGGSIGGNTSRIPTKLKRKRAKDCSTDWNIFTFKVEPLGVGDFYGFELDGNHRFLLDDFTVQHNSGKTYCTAIVMLYEIYWLTCMIDPIKTLNVANIVIALLSKDISAAVSQIGGEVYKGLTQTPYFKGVVRDKISFSKIDKEGVRITDDIIIRAGASLSCFIGTNLYASCLDEACANSPRIAAENLVETRMRMYNEMFDRRRASYDRAPKPAGMLMFTSSPTDEGDVLSEIITDLKLKESKGEAKPLIRDNIARWEAREESMDDTFSLFLGSDTKDPCVLDGTIKLNAAEMERVIEVPRQYETDFLTNPYDSIQNIAGRRTMPESSLFNSVAIFEKVFYKKNYIFSSDTPTVTLGNGLSLDDYLIDKDYFSHPDHPDCFRYIHLDMAYRGDRFGISSVYSDRVKYTSEDGHEIWRRKYYIDFCLGIQSSNKENVDILKVLEFIYSLKERGYEIKLLTTDNMQGETARQMIAKRGVKTEYLSVERSKEQYLNLKNMILTESLEGFKNPALIKELHGLRESQKRIEKGKGYTDDMSDSLAGALWSCSQDRFFKINNQAISDIIRETGQMNMDIRNSNSFTNISKSINRNNTRGNLGFNYRNKWF